MVVQRFILKDKVSSLYHQCKLRNVAKYLYSIDIMQSGPCKYEGRILLRWYKFWNFYLRLVFDFCGQVIHWSCCVIAAKSRSLSGLSWLIFPHLFLLLWFHRILSRAQEIRFHSQPANKTGSHGNMTLRWPWHWRGQTRYQKFGRRW